MASPILQGFRPHSVFSAESLLLRLSRVPCLPLLSLRGLSEPVTKFSQRFCSIDVGGIHALNLAKRKPVATAREWAWIRWRGGLRQRVGQINFFAKPDQSRRFRKAKFGESSGDVNRFPSAVVDIWSSIIGFLANIVLVVPMHDVVDVLGSVRGFETFKFGEGTSKSWSGRRAAALAQDSAGVPPTESMMRPIGTWISC